MSKRFFKKKEWFATSRLRLKGAPSFDKQKISTTAGKSFW
jgi:hypothetical protein